MFPTTLQCSCPPFSPVPQRLPKHHHSFKGCFPGRQAPCCPLLPELGIAVRAFLLEPLLPGLREVSGPVQSGASAALHPSCSASLAALPAPLCAGHNDFIGEAPSTLHFHFSPCLIYLSKPL